MTRPVPNTNAPMVDKQGKIINPWNIWFQQFSQQAPKAVTITAASPYRSNNFGTVIITGTVIKLTRGTVIITFGNGQFIIPVSIGDIISWTTASSVQFLET
jgi:hypothetical protein